MEGKNEQEVNVLVYVLRVLSCAKDGVPLLLGLRPILLYCIGIAIQRIVGGIASRQQYEIRCEVLF